MVNRGRVRQRIAVSLVASETTKEIGENPIPARLTDNPLISLETAKGKVWNSLEKFGEAWNFLGIPLKKCVNP